jgi:protein disulfide-isomerase A1
MIYIFTILVALLVARDGMVEELSESNFNTFIESNERVLIEFYAPWCGHCKALEPEYEKAAAGLEAIDSKTRLAKIDATVEKDLAMKYDVNGFPTLKYFQGDPEVAVDYSGGRTEATIVSWVIKRELPVVSMLETPDELEHLKQKGELVLVGFTASESDEMVILQEFGESQRDHCVTGIGTEDLAKSLDLPFPSYILYRSFDETPVTGEDFVGVNEFFQNHRFPVLDEMKPENYQLYMDRGIPVAWLSVMVDDDETKKIFEKHAASYIGVFSAVWVDAVKYKEHIVGNLGIANTPGLMIVNTQKNLKFSFSGSFSEDADFEAFFEGFVQDTLDSFQKSQDPPTEDDGNVKIIVGSTWQELVKDRKDGAGVFLMYYAPWCGHCKKLIVQWKALADDLIDEQRIVIAKLDATENDSPEPIQGFPTVVFYPPSGEKEVYRGERTLEDLKEFVEKKLQDFPSMDPKEEDDQAVHTHDEL